MTLDPWGSSLVDDYERLCADFGIELIDPLLDDPVIKKNRYFRRKVIFGHRDFGHVVRAIYEGKPWAVMSGIKPSGPFHLGTFTTASEIVRLQEMGGKAFYCIADVESWQDNGVSYEEASIIAIDNLADIIAVGLDPDNAYIWRQSNEETVKSIPYYVSKGVTNNMLNAIYGERQFGIYLSAMVQVGDILLPQLLDGAMPTVVPVGIDQDPHIRLTRDLCRKYYEKTHKFFLPGATYHKLLEGLDGAEKMSKRNPNSYFTFSEEQESIEKKLKNALTGGRNSLKEQKELGGEPDKCMIYKLLMYHFLEDDDKLLEIRGDCLGGRLMCGDCKKFAINKILEYVAAHKTRKEKAIPLAKKILGLEDIEV